MIGKLKPSAAFTTKLEGMFKDMALSEEVMQKYTRTSSSVSTQGIAVHVHVLTSGFWPTYPPVQMVLPSSLLAEQEKFSTFYKEKYGGRKLQWQHSLDSCVVKAKFPKTTKEFVVSGFQAAVLVLFDGMGEGDKLEYREIQAKTRIPESELTRTLQSLACGKVHPIRKRPKARKILPTDYFIVAHDFKDKRYRIKINQVQMKQTKQEQEKTAQKVFRDRQHQVDASNRPHHENTKDPETLAAHGRGYGPD